MSRTKRKKADLESLKSQITGYETQISFSKADVKQTKNNLDKIETRINSLASAISQKEDEHKKIKAKADKATAAVTELGTEMETEVDKVFQKFCAKIGVDNVREYEGASLAEQQKVMQKKAA